MNRKMRDSDEMIAVVLSDGTSHRVSDCADSIFSVTGIAPSNQCLTSNGEVVIPRDGDVVQLVRRDNFDDFSSAVNSNNAKALKLLIEEERMSKSTSVWSWQIAEVLSSVACPFNFSRWSMKEFGVSHENVAEALEELGEFKARCDRTAVTRLFIERCDFQLDMQFIDWVILFEDQRNGLTELAHLCGIARK